MIASGKVQTRRKKLNKASLVWICVLAALTAVCTCIYVASVHSEEFAEYFTRNIAKYFRLGLGAASSVFPFSFAEFLLYAFVVLIALTVVELLVFFFRLIFGSLGNRFPRTVIVPVVILVIVWDLFAVTLGPAYYRTDMEKQLDLGGDFTEDQLFDTFEWIIDELNKCSEKVTYDSRGEGRSGRSFSETSTIVNDAVNALAGKHPFLQSAGFKAKPVLLSVPMTYTHISGVYSFFTGESNVNVNYPEYIYTFTAAHECMHQRGIAYENEANFGAFVTCIESGDVFLRYAGFANMYTSIAGSVYKTNKDRYYACAAQLSPKVAGEYRAYSEFFEKYEDNPFEKTASKVNDTYLKSQGQQQGVVTYSMITRLTVNYHGRYVMQ